MLRFEKGTGRSAGRSGPLRLLAVAAVLLAVTLAVGSTAMARTPLQGPSSSAPSEKLPADRGPTDEREVEAFLDGYVGHQLENYDIPGATVSVVKDGEVLFAKGYGQANVEKKEPVVADETLFRIASISKLFTATAVMQLVEEGKLDLDRDVNAYLEDFEVPNTHPGRPVTLRHLLTHTAGFEERFTGSGARNAADVETLGEYVATQMPARVRPPGEVTAYSNYGMSLAGYVVQEVSGMPYERYVEENILAPLGMEGTTAAQPPAPELRERLAAGYDVEGGEPVARPLEYIDDAPAGTVTTTATDMARFMIAHLQDGRYGRLGGETRILKESTAKEMHERQFANDPRLDGMAYGFYEQTINGERTVQHGGNLRQFHANLVLLPEQDVGIFVAYNSYGDGGDFAEYELVEAFLDRYYPEPPPPTLEPSGEGASRNAERLAGSYRITRSNHTGFEKVLTLLTGASVTANEDGSITTTGGYLSRNLEETEQRWVEVKPLLFRAEDGSEHIAFREDGDGRALYLSGDADPTVAYEKVAPYEAPGLHLGLLAGSLGILSLTAVAWPAGAMISRRYKKRYGEPIGDKPGADTNTARRARILAWGVCALDLLFVIGVALAFSSVEETLAYGASPSLIAILTLPLPSAVLTAGVLACALLAWKRRYWGVFGRLHYSLVALSALTFVALLGYYNLLGFQF
jgi:CubicO group peptidase (beta-lactamase class C family)